MKKFYPGSAPELERYAQVCLRDNIIDKELYGQYRVNRGLRDITGKGVLTGLTEISEIKAKETVNGEDVPCPGQLYYRGYAIEDVAAGAMQREHHGYEETVFLLLFGHLPNRREFEDFKQVLSKYRELPSSFVRDFIMKAPSPDIMNGLARSVLALYSYDECPDDTDVPNVLRQCLRLISLFPQLAVYGYQAFSYYIQGNGSFFIHEPIPEKSSAENILYMLRLDGSYSELEARILDLCLILHAEHGGGNNSTFTTHVVTSSGTDTYSAVAAALGSLKGPKHGGANIKVRNMFLDIEAHVKDWADDEEIGAYIDKLLSKEAFDHSGLVYGIGHAVYSVSDPRAELLRHQVGELAKQKNRMDEFGLFSAVARLAPERIAGSRKMYKGVSPNVDFWSGFVYDMLGIPESLYTPLFAVSRIAGWSAHRVEEIINGNKIIRPAYMNVRARRVYEKMEDRR